MFLVMGAIYVFSTIGGADVVYAFISKQFTLPPKFGDFILRPWTIITYAFAHSLTDIFHILFNMLIFYWFGRLFIEYLGNDKLIALYLLGAIAGGVVYLLVFNLVPYFVERSDFAGMIGASAAVYAIVTGAAVLLPNYTFYLLFLGPVRIKYIAGFYIALSFLGSVGSNAGGNIAHLGGALIGFIYIKQLQVGVNWGGWITVTLDWFKELFQPRPKVKVTYRKEEPKPKSKGKPTGASKASQEEIDAILDKISERGYESLSSDEKEKLFNASKK
ncbi:MAG TPA: rhomboid family intramembrane serine protease [Cytophagales bacterium]|nr:rhomboid family intramembrane serine protease [Cytophagales bacterium]HCR53370.1 rhomboid family intramembrane serine protease [Cytophagales bacterium]